MALFFLWLVKFSSTCNGLLRVVQSLCRDLYQNQADSKVVLQQAFAECRRVLRPDGLLMGSVLGGDSLFELRSACHAAEEERFGGVSQRTSPLMHVRKATACLSVTMHATGGGRCL